MDEKKNDVSNKNIDCIEMIEKYKKKCLNENENDKCKNFTEFILFNCKDDEFKKFIDM